MAILITRNSPIDNPDFHDLIDSGNHKVLIEMPDGCVIDLANPYIQVKGKNNGFI